MASSVCLFRAWYILPVLSSFTQTLVASFKWHNMSRDVATGICLLWLCSGENTRRKDDMSDNEAIGIIEKTLQAGGCCQYALDRR